MSFHWFKIFENETSIDDLLSPGTMMQFEFKNEKILVTRTRQGLYAVQDRCPHNGASLSKGFCSKNNEIICPLHRYSFDLSSGKATSGGSYTLKTYPIEQKADGWYLGIKAKWWEM